MLLTDRQITSLALEHQMISPFDPLKLNSCGYDLTLGSDFKIPALDSEQYVVDPFNPPSFIDKVCLNFIIIPPNSFVIGASKEYLTMPPDILGVCLGRSTYARAGVISHVTPLEPGWKGNVTIEISNTNPLPVKVWVDKGITQVIFLRASEMPQKDYVAKGGRYQNQEGVNQGRPDA